MKLKNFKPHKKITRKRVNFPAIRVTEKGYFILNAKFIREIGQGAGGFVCNLLYSKKDNSIGIEFQEYKSLEEPENIKPTLCAKYFIVINYLDGKFDHNKFYPVEKIMKSSKKQVWAFRLGKDE